LKVRIEGLRVVLGGVSVVEGFSMVTEESSISAVMGRSGSGKTTILRALVGIIPYVFPGEVSGVIEPPPSQIRRASFYVPQEPWYAASYPFVWMEAEYFSESADEVYEYLRLLGLDRHADRSVYTLSAGELHRLNLAVAAASGMKVLILDEPLAHLDGDNVSRVLRLLEKMRSEGRAVIVSEHREKIVEVADRVYRLTDLTWDSLGEELAPPSSVGDEVCSVDISEYGYPGQRPVLKSVRFSMHEGDIVWIRGPSGSGKSTLLRLLARSASSGRYRAVCRSKPIYVPENPLLFFSEPRPINEIDPSNGFCRWVVEQLGLSISTLRRPVMALSSGERRRAAIATAICRRRGVVLLDEPSTGLDPLNRFRLLKLISTLADKGYAFVVASHEEEFGRIATRVMDIHG